MIKGTLSYVHTFKGTFAAGVGYYAATVDWTDIQISEAAWYRPKRFGVLPPTDTITLTAELIQTYSGSPPDPAYFDVDTEGKVDNTSLDDGAGNSGAFSCRGQGLAIKLDTIDAEGAIYDGLQNSLAVPPSTEPIGTVQITDRATHGHSGSSWYLDGDGTPGTDYMAFASFSDTNPGPSFEMDDQDYDADIYEATDEIGVFFNYIDYAAGVGHLSMPIDEAFFVLTATSLLETDYHEGEIIEKGVTTILSVMGLTQGKFGPALGALLEYQKDQKFGDLDLPLEIINRRLKVNA